MAGNPETKACETPADQYEAARAEATATTEAAMSAGVSPDHWRFYSWGDAPAAIGGGVGAFQWVESREKLIEYIGDHLTFSSPGRYDEAPVVAATREIAARMLGGYVSDADAISQLNAAQKTFSQVGWIGTAKALINGPSDFARDVRARFWERREESGDGPIPVELLEEFTDALLEHGL